MSNSMYSNSYVPTGAQAANWRKTLLPEARGPGKDTNQYYADHSLQVDTSGNAPSAVDRTMPKHFARPLTCFYWRTHGRCNKPDEQCLYAHFDTGNHASAPFRIGTGEVAIAGRSAEMSIVASADANRNPYERERAFHDQERTIRDHEKQAAVLYVKPKAHRQPSGVMLEELNVQSRKMQSREEVANFERIEWKTQEQVNAEILERLHTVEDAVRSREITASAFEKKIAVLHSELQEELQEIKAYNEALNVQKRGLQHFIATDVLYHENLKAREEVLTQKIIHLGDLARRTHKLLHNFDETTAVARRQLDVACDTILLSLFTSACDVNEACDGVTNLRDRCNRYFETMANGTKQIQDHITGHVMPLEYSTGHQDLLDPRLM